MSLSIASRHSRRFEHATKKSVMEVCVLPRSVQVHSVVGLRFFYTTSLVSYSLL